jgi:hypothetical protein
MIQRLSPQTLSLSITAFSFLLAIVSVQLGRRLNYLDHLLMFNGLAITMLALVAVAIGVAFTALLRNRGRSLSLWFSTGLALMLLGSYLLDE